MNLHIYNSLYKLRRCTRFSFLFLHNYTTTSFALLLIFLPNRTCFKALAAASSAYYLSSTVVVVVLQRKAATKVHFLYKFVYVCICVCVFGRKNSPLTCKNSHFSAAKCRARAQLPQCADCSSTLPLRSSCCMFNLSCQLLCFCAATLSYS